MFKIQISNEIIEDHKLTNKAFYLYVYLKIYSKSNKQAYVFTKELMRQLNWKDKSTLKKYLLQLKNAKYINYNLEINEQGNEVLPIHNAITIYFINENLLREFTQLDEDILLKIQTLASKTELHKLSDGKYIIDKIFDEKESATRIYYLYEKLYNKEHKYSITISYKEIFNMTGCNNQITKGINDLLINNKLLIIKQGNKYNENIRSRNSYLPIWDMTRRITQPKLE